MPNPTLLSSTLDQIDAPAVPAADTKPVPENPGVAHIEKSARPTPEVVPLPGSGGADDNEGLSLAEIAGRLVDKEIEKGNDLFAGDPNRTQHLAPVKPAEGDAKPPAKGSAEEERELAEETKDMAPPAGERFRALKGSLKEAKGEIETLKAQVEEAKKSSLSPDDASAQAKLLEQLQAELGQYRQERGAYMVEKTPEFLEQVTQPLAALVKTISALAARNGIDEAALIEAYETADPKLQTEKLSELADDLHERDKLKLYEVADALDLIFDRRNSLRENSTKVMAEVEARQATASEAEAGKRREAYQAAAGAVWGKLNDKLGLKEELAPIKKNGMDFDFNASTPDDQAYAVYAGMLLPTLVAEKAALAKEVAELKNSLGRVSGVTPGAGEGSGPPEALSATTEGMDMAAYADAAFKARGYTR